MEKIQDHPIKDIWRVQDGLLIEINKYEEIGKRLLAPKTKVVRGCKGLRALKEPCGGFPIGTLIFGWDYPVKPIEDVSKFTAEVKSSGGSIYGSMGHINKVMNQIKEILQSYI